MNKAPNQFKLALGLTKFAVLATFRNKVSYFFGLMFPIVFVIVFGSLGGGTQKITFGIPEGFAHDNPVYMALAQMSEGDKAVVELKEEPLTDLEVDLKEGRLAAILKTENKFFEAPSLVLVTSNNNLQGGASAASLLRGIVSELNLLAAGVTDPQFAVETKELSGKPYRYIDFALPGQIGFSLLALATFGVAFPLLTLRRTLVLKRMFATSVKPITFLVSQGLSRSVQALIQAAIILGVGVILYDFTLLNGWVSVVNMLILCLLAILAFMGFGILIGNIARDEQSLPIALNLFNLPQILLAGVFFPTDSLPKWASLIGNNLPLAYLNISLRKVAGEGLSLLDVWPYVAGMFAWGIVAYILAARTFKSE